MSDARTSGPRASILRGLWKSHSTRNNIQHDAGRPEASAPNDRNNGNSSSNSGPPKWSMGMLNDPSGEQVPGSVLLLSKTSQFNEPLGLSITPARTSRSSIPSDFAPRRSRSTSRRRASVKESLLKRSADGKFVLEPQPDDSLNDPLNWRVWRRDVALVSLGFYCMLGGGMTPILAAGFNNVATDFDVPVAQVALTTGLYMLGLGVGSVFLSPTAILFGKRPVYLAAALCFLLTSVWCALSPNFASLVVARVCMGIAVSSVECLPSATIAEIFFLHEKGYRLGIYTLLLLGGKNLVPLVSAVIIQALGWRWVFWIVAIVVGFGFVLLYAFVPETFWDRTPTPYKARLPGFSRSQVGLSDIQSKMVLSEKSVADLHETSETRASDGNPGPAKHAHFTSSQVTLPGDANNIMCPNSKVPNADGEKNSVGAFASSADPHETLEPADKRPPLSARAVSFPDHEMWTSLPSAEANRVDDVDIAHPNIPAGQVYTMRYQAEPPQTFVQQLRPWSGRLSGDNWLRVAVRPFILFAYPSICWSALVYALSIGWLIVLSESVSTIYESRATYHFTALQTGLVYISPFVGGVLGTAVAGKVSDAIVRSMARRNGGIYEPEFRLVMAIPITFFTTIGLMGYGWAAAERDFWFVPTFFFGVISCGCSIGSTTAITFAVDSYRQYAGEALVTLNFAKNVGHGFVFSLFFNRWLTADGSKLVFVIIGVIQCACMMTTIPMYIYGKRARMWTVRKNMMENF